MPTSPFPLMHPRAAGVDVGDRAHFVAVPADRPGQLPEVRRFDTFTLDAHDGDNQGGSPDRLRVRISHVDPLSGAEVVDYDNATPATPATVAAAAATLDRTAVDDGGVTLRH